MNLNKAFFAISLLFFVTFTVSAQSQKQKSKETAGTNPDYDRKLAERLGGDQYGMKNYFLVILKTGPTKSTDNEFINSKFKGHLDNINRLVKQGKLIVAGPFSKNEREFRGIFIFDKIQSIEEVSQLLQTDPAIQSGLLDYEIFKWYGSAALPEYLRFAEKIWLSKP